MANKLLEKLAEFGIGVKGPIQKEIESNPYLTWMHKGPGQGPMTPEIMKAKKEYYGKKKTKKEEPLSILQQYNLVNKTLEDENNNLLVLNAERQDTDASMNAIQNSIQRIDGLERIRDYLTVKLDEQGYMDRTPPQIDWKSAGPLLGTQAMTMPMVSVPQPEIQQEDVREIRRELPPSVEKPLDDLIERTTVDNSDLSGGLMPYRPIVDYLQINKAIEAASEALVKDQMESPIHAGTGRDPIYFGQSGAGGSEMFRAYEEESRRRAIRNAPTDLLDVAVEADRGVPQQNKFNGLLTRPETVIPSAPKATDIVPSVRQPEITAPKVEPVIADEQRPVNIQSTVDLPITYTYESYKPDPKHGLVYGKTATKTANERFEKSKKDKKEFKEFEGIVLHHDLGKKSITRKLDYYGTYDDKRINKEGKLDPGFYGYHFAIDEKGNVYQVAPLNKRTNHMGSEAKPEVDKKFKTKFSNANTIGIAYLGSNGGVNEEMTPAAIRAQNALIEKLVKQFNINSDAVFAHTDISTGKSATEGKGAVQAWQTYITDRNAIPSSRAIPTN